MSTREIDSLAQSALDTKWHLDPVAATAAGVHEHDARFGRFTSDDLTPHLAAIRSLTGALEALEVDSLDDEIDRTALLNDLRVLVHRFVVETPQAVDPGFYVNHLFEGLYRVLERPDVTEPQREHCLLGRLGDIPAFLANATDALERPSALLSATAAQIAHAGRNLVEYAGRQTPGASETVKRALTALDDFIVSLTRWASHDETGWAIGAAAFEFRLRFEHGLRPTTGEVWRIGDEMITTALAEVQDAADRLGARDWRQLIHDLRAEHTQPDGVLDAYRREMDRAREFVVDNDLAAVPDASLHVVPTPPFMRPMIPFAAYEPAGPRSAEPDGRFLITLPAASSTAAGERIQSGHCVHDLAGTAVHEGFPGHHLQFSSMRSLSSLVRRHIWSPVMVEGWALYCEDMMAEQGFYPTPESDLLRRVALLWRALRVQLDIELHTRDLPPLSAVDRLVDVVAMEPAAARTEVQRYCTAPAYQLSYAVGRRALLRLRDTFFATHGRHLRTFHDEVLRYGGLPVSLAEWGLNAGAA